MTAAGRCASAVLLVLAAWAGPAPGAARPPAASWRFEAWPVRLPIEVKAAGCPRRDWPVEVPVNFTEALAALGRAAGLEETSLRVVEVDAAGRVLDDAVLHQFDPADDYDRATRARGTLVFLMKGATPATGVRRFHVYFNVAGSLVRPLAQDPLLTLLERVPCEGQESLKIVTPGAVYVYHPRGGGLARLEDSDGHDWIGYRTLPGSAGAYRGIPNLAHPEDVFHPGRTKCETRIVHRGPIRITLASRSADRQWACRWEFLPRWARMTVEKAGHPYWFLYEGTPGGSLDPETDYVVRSPGVRTPASQAWEGALPAPQWAYFGDAALGRVLAFMQHDADAAVDSYRPMEGRMTVFGFGRKSLNKYIERTPARFTVAFVEDTAQETVVRALEALLREPEAAVGKAEARP